MSVYMLHYSGDGWCCSLKPLVDTLGKYLHVWIRWNHGFCLLASPYSFVQQSNTTKLPQLSYTWLLIRVEYLY